MCMPLKYSTQGVQKEADFLKVVLSDGPSLNKAHDSLLVLHLPKTVNPEMVYISSVACV